jgi:hypothetical protein
MLSLVAMRNMRPMTAFCASCAREMVGGPVMRGGWLYCSFSCAREPGASNRAWHGRLKGRTEEPALEQLVHADRQPGLTLPAS